MIKAGVDISRLERNTRKGLQKAAYQYEFYGEEIVVTSTYEGNHGPGSLHYANQAFDARLPHASADAIISGMINTMGPEFDVVQEKTHIHIEYDPK